MDLECFNLKTIKIQTIWNRIIEIKLNFKKWADNKFIIHTIEFWKLEMISNLSIKLRFTWLFFFNHIFP